MDTVDIRTCYPVLAVEDGILLSRRGDVCFGWELALPAPLHCGAGGYETLVSALRTAASALPDRAILHKQDCFMRVRYNGAPPGSTPSFLGEAYERHFEGRAYLEHRSYLWLCLPAGSSGGAWRLPSRSLPGASRLEACSAAAEQFEAMAGACPHLSLRRLTTGEIAGTRTTPGILQDHLNFSRTGEDTLCDITASRSCIEIGGRPLHCHVVSDLSQLPGEVSSSVRRPDLSTDSSEAVESFLGTLGLGLDCPHMVDWYMVLDPQREILGSLDRRRRGLSALSRDAGDRVHTEEIGRFLEGAASSGRRAVRCHLGVFAYAEDSPKVASALSSRGIVPARAAAAVPSLFWATIPGNEASLPRYEYMTMDIDAALCLGLYEGPERGIEGGTLKLCDRRLLVPRPYDIGQKAFGLGLVDNYNAFVLGPSGSGKSFFMNKHLLCCWEAGAHVMLLDVGDSYKGLCSIINEQTRGSSGTYHDFSGGSAPLNPFSCAAVPQEESDPEEWQFLQVLVSSLWKGGAELSPACQKHLRDSLDAFGREWTAGRSPSREPLFDDYYRFLRDSFRRNLEGRMYLEDLLVCLEPYSRAGAYGRLLGSPAPADFGSDRFVVFEIDRVKDDPVAYPVATLLVMEAFRRKIRRCPGMKVICVEEAWKALSGTRMASYMVGLWKTARKHCASAVAVTQELGDIASSDVVRGTILENSSVKVLLDQTRYLNDFSTLASALSLSEGDKALVLSLNRGPGASAPGREVFISLGNRASTVMRVEVSEEERIAFSSGRQDRALLEEAVLQCGGSHIQAVRMLASRTRATTSHYYSGTGATIAPAVHTTAVPADQPHTTDSTDATVQSHTTCPTNTSDPITTAAAHTTNPNNTPDPSHTTDPTTTATAHTTAPTNTTDPSDTTDPTNLFLIND